MPKPNILLFQNRSIAILYLTIFLSAVGLGISRFLFPMRFLELGGTESLVSLAGAIFSLGQLLGIFLLSKLLNKTGYEFFVSTLSWLLAIFLPLIPWYPIMFFSRFFEGVGYGVLTIAVLTLCSVEAKERISEAIGTLLGAVFLGTALGQGLGGLFKTYLFSWWNFSGIFSALQMSFLLAGLFAFSPLIISLIQAIKTRKHLEPKESVSLGHFHLKELKSLFKVPSFIFIFLLYCLYDLSHGLYTPNLLVMFTNSGFNEAEVGVIFFLGDAVWGVAQIFTGKLADRFGNWFPIIVSIILKGAGVLMYPFAKGIFFLGAALIIVGFAEALLEPARNSEVLTIEGRLKDISPSTNEHTHKHINISYFRNRGFTLGIHAHIHEHQVDKEVVLGIFQTAGIISFGLGGSLGSFLLSRMISLETITFIGAGIILINIIFCVFGLLLSKKQKQFIGKSSEKLETLETEVK